MSNGGKADSTPSLLRRAEDVKQMMGGAKDIWACRQQLQDLYRRILLADLDAALENLVDQDLWNLVFHPQILALQTALKETKGDTAKSPHANLALFLDCANGFFFQLLQELCQQFEVDLPMCASSRWFGMVTESGKTLSSLSQSERYICQYCLVHLGDLARYRHHSQEARTYYLHAVHLGPANGQPYNQLAIVAGASSDWLSAVYYHCRSLAVQRPFLVARENLIMLFDKLETWKPTSDAEANKKFVWQWLACFSTLYQLEGLPEQAASEVLGEFQVAVCGNMLTADEVLQITVIAVFLLHYLFDDEADDLTKRERLRSIAMDIFMGLTCVLLKHVSMESVESVLPEVFFPALSVSMLWLQLNWNIASSFLLPSFWQDLAEFLNKCSGMNSTVACPHRSDLKAFQPLQVTDQLSSLTNSDSCSELFLEFGIWLCDHCRSLHRNANGLFSCHLPNEIRGKPNREVGEQEVRPSNSLSGSAQKGTDFSLFSTWTPVKLAPVFSTPANEAGVAITRAERSANIIPSTSSSATTMNSPSTATTMNSPSTAATVNSPSSAATMNSPSTAASTDSACAVNAVPVRSATADISGWSVYANQQLDQPLGISADSPVSTWSSQQSQAVLSPLEQLLQRHEKP